MALGAAGAAGAAVREVGGKKKFTLDRKPAAMLSLSLSLSRGGLAAKLAAHAALILLFFLLNLAALQAGLATFNKEDVTWFDMLDYTFVTWTTVGYGNVYPTNAVAKVLSWGKMIAFLALTIA